MKARSSDLLHEITRREWLLRLGGTVTLSGVSGLVPETVLSLLSDEKPPLPPGLYRPSTDHLVGVLGGHHRSSPPGSETDYVLPAASYALQFFSAEDFSTVTSFVSTLLGDVSPNTLNEVARWCDLWFHSAQNVREAARNLDPLHRKLSIAYFGEAAVTEIESADPAAVARQGLADLNRLCREEHGNPFASLDLQERQALVRSISSGRQSGLQKFFELIRNEAIRGYYTSAEGLKELEYKGNAYYPECPGCESAPKNE